MCGIIIITSESRSLLWLSIIISDVNMNLMTEQCPLFEGDIHWGKGIFYNDTFSV